MKRRTDIYHPTVWRTCRALMNKRRLACLSAVSETPGLSVGEIAETAGVPENQASMNLRALQARGMLVARREGRRIRYFAEPDPLVKHAAAVLAAMLLELKSGGAEKLMGTLRAFTHSRRLTILKCLMRQGGATCEAIVSRTRISRPAVSRHLTTLCGAGLVLSTKDGVWRLRARRSLSALERTLIGVVEIG
jgi:DNA-binding transcriptional ArsR family regulator